MDIKSLEINVFKASEIKDGDILLVKMDNKDKANLTKEDIRSIYDQLTKIIDKKDLSIYFFPKNLSIDIIKNEITTMQEVKPQLEKQINENETIDSSNNS